MGRFSLGLPTLDLNGAGVAAAAVTYDRYIATTGSDAADGSEATPWASFAPLITLAQAAADDAQITCLVRQGDYLDKLLTIGVNVNAGVKLTISFEAGTIMRGSTGVDQSWIDVSGGAWTCELIGLGPSIRTGGGAGLRITGYDFGTGNGLGASSAGGAILIARNVQADNCQDGVSNHGTNSTIRTYDCIFRDCLKFAGAHVHTGGSILHEDTDFYGAAVSATGGLYSDGSSVSQNSVYNRVRFIPGSTTLSTHSVDLKSGVANDCQFGTLTIPVKIVHLTGVAAITDSYMHAYFDQNTPVHLVRCYGRVTIRQRNNAVGSIVDRCVFIDSAASPNAVDSFLYRNFDPTSAAKIEIINTVLKGFSTAVGQGYSATDAGYFVGSVSTLLNCCLNGNTTNIDADLVTAGAGAGYTAIAGNITTDPQLGAANTYVQADYAVAPGSPCVGAGLAAANIGFTAADIAA